MKKTVFRPVFFILLILFIITTEVTCKRKDKENNKRREKNLCKEPDRDSHIVCYCNQNEVNRATLANCWVFNGQVEKNDPIWHLFSSQIYLETIKFNVRPDGKLSNIPTNSLKELSHLRIIEVLYGSIPVINEYAFANLSSLEEIILSRNQISLLQQNSFTKLKNLTLLNLDENRISELTRNVFVDLPSLTKLYVARNNITIIHDYAFENLKNLEDLELHGNEISVITKETFIGLYKLKKLDLRQNHMTMIGDNVFSHLGHLHELDLDENEIEFISDDGFAGLNRLSRLRIGENKLMVLSDYLFNNVNGIYFLDLRNNDLKTLTFNTLQPLWDNFKNSTAYLFLEGNKLKCDCHLSWVYMLKNETNNEQVRNTLDTLKCIIEDVHLLGDTTTSNLMDPTHKPYEQEVFDVDAVQYDDGTFEYEEDEEEDEESVEKDGIMKKHVLDIPIEKLPCPEALSNLNNELDVSQLSNEIYNSAATNVKFNIVTVFLYCIVRLFFNT